MAGLDQSATESELAMPKPSEDERLTGRKLMREWKVDVKQARYHRDGAFFENLTVFPGAMFDPNGYVVFDTQAEYNSTKRLRIGQKLNVPGGIRNLQKYVEVSSRST